MKFNEVINVGKDIIKDFPYRFFLNLFGRIVVLGAGTHFIATYNNSLLLKILMFLGIVYYCFDREIEDVIWTFKRMIKGDE